MKRKSKSILKCVMTFVLTIAMVLGAIPLPQFTMVAHATTSTITVDGTDYTLFTGFTATAGTAGMFGYTNFVDGNTSTKWWVSKNYDDPNAPVNDFAGGTEDPAYVEFHADAPFIPKGYILTYDNSANESWKPTSWALKAKLNESDNWTTIHSSNSSLGNGSRFEIACNNDGDNMYQYFRFEIYDVGTTYQSILNELEFYGNTGFIHLTPKVATCTETGIKQECWYSNGKYFSDANGTTELDESAIVEPMKAHTCVHHEASATNTEYWQCSVCGKYFSDSGCTNEISEAEALIGVFGAIADGRYTLTSQTYTLTDDINTAGYIYVPAGVTATIDLAGHTIDRGLTSADNNGSVIIVAGTLTITDSGTDGKIQGGYDGYAEHGFYVSGVEVQNGATFNLQGGTLVGRNQDCDYTVAVDDNGSFTMTGGKITGGWTGVLAFGNVTLTGGEISGNSNSGVRVSENISISGNPVITGNTVMNVDLRSSGGICKINITGALTDGANIGITVHNPTDNSPVTVTSGYNTYNSVSPDTYFSLDNDGQIQTSPIDYMTVVMGWDEDGTEIAVGTASRTVNFDLQGHGSNIEAVSLLNGYKLIEPTAPTAEGWSFGGWYTDANCTDDSEWSFNSGVTSDMTLYALWTQGQTYRVTLPENMLLVSADNEVVGGKYPTGTNIRFKVKSADYVVDGDVKNGEDVLTADGNGIYTVTVGNADITITATVKKAVEANKELSGSESYTAQNGDVLTGSTSGTVTIPDGESITLSDVNITGGIVCNGTATITLVGTNSVSGATNKAGIQIGGSGTTLTIKGNGSLTANGGSQSAGIGLSRAWDVDATGGDIVIEGGNITATGDNFGAGIGTGVSYGNGTDNTATIGNITIKGGTVKAIGGTHQSYPGSGIGKGGAYSNGHAVVGTITIYDDINMVDASSISESIVYMHETTDVTASKTNYFVFTNGGNKIFSSAKIIENIAIATISDYVFTGSAIKPEPVVKSGSLTFAKGTDYEYSYSDNTKVGKAKVTVTFKGDYASLGSVEKEFNIVKATPTVTAPTANTLTYNGNEQELVTAGSTDFGKVLYSLEENGTYTADIPTATAAGDYTVYYKVEGSDNWNAVDAQTIQATIASNAKAVTNSDISIAIPSQTYTGSELTPVITVKDGETTLTLGEDYTVTAPSGTIQDAGDYTYTITGQGNYTGETTATFTIEPKPITITGATATERNYVKDSTSVEISAVTFEGATLTKGTDYTVTGAMDDDTAGDSKSVTVTVTLMNGNYTFGTNGNTTTTTVKIDKINHDGVSASGSAKYGAEGMVDLSSLIEAGGSLGEVSVTDTNGVLDGTPTIETDGKTLKFKFSNNSDNVGKTATVTIPVRGATNYKDYNIVVTLTVAEKIVPTLTVSDYTKTYDGNSVTISDLTKSAKDGSSDIEGTWDFEGTPGLKNVSDSGTITVRFTPTDTANYESATATFMLTINRKAVTVKADNKSMVVGTTPEPELTATVSGTVGNDTVIYSLVREAGTVVGDYVITPSGDTLQGNYTVSYETGTFMITEDTTAPVVKKAPKAVTNLVYNGKAQALVEPGEAENGTMVYAVTKAGDPAPSAELYTTSNYTATNAGSYYVYYKVIGDNDHRDSDVFEPVTVTIAPAAITITPDDKSSKYRTPIQELTYQVGGAYHEGDELNVTLETTATATSTVGEYPITVKSWENANYTSTLESGTYTVTRTDLTVTAFGYDGTYDGEDHDITVDVGDSDAVVYYSTDKELTKDNYKQDGSTTNPVRRDAGKTTVYYYVETVNFDPQPVSGSKEINIAKATNTAVPEKLTATKASSGISDAVINGVNDTMEYSTDGGQTWKKVPTGAASVTGLSTGEVQVRYAESTNYKAGAAVTVTILAKDDQAAPDSNVFTVTRTSTSIEKDGSINGVNDRMEYSVDGGRTWTKVPAGSTVITGLGAGNVLIRYAGNADYNPSPAVSVKVGFGSGELMVYFAPDSDSEYDQIVTYNEELKQYEYVYTGSGIMPAIIVEGLDGRLTEGLDYTVSYSNNVNVDKKGKPAQVTVTGKGNFEKKKTLDFYILPKALDDGNGNAADDINVAKVVVAQGGTAVPVVSYNGNVLKKTDYTVTSSTGSLKFKTAVEGATLTITAKEGSNFTGTIKDIPVTVLTKAEAKKLAIKVTLAKGVSRTYTGEPQTLRIAVPEGTDNNSAGSATGTGSGTDTAEITVTDASGKILTEGTDFEVSYSANVNVGTVKVTVTGTGDYTGTVTKTFKIVPDKKDAVIKTYFEDGMISTEDTANAPKFAYRKGGVKPRIVVTAERGDEVLTLSEGTDYKISYSGNNKAGTKAKFTITFMGNYKGRADLKNQTFEITKGTLADADITVGDKAYTTYTTEDGRKYVNKSVPYVSIDGVQLAQNTDYTVTYWYNGQQINADKIKLAANEESRVITVKITGKGNYEAETFETTYTVKKLPAQSVVNLSKAKIYAKGTKKAVPAQGYIGEPLEPEIDVYVKIGKTWTKVDESRYTVTYVNNIERGKAKILVNGDGEGAVGSKNSTFKIVRWKFSLLNQLVD